MLDIKYILKNPKNVKKGLLVRGIKEETIDLIINKYNDRQQTLIELESLRHYVNIQSKAIGKLTFEGKDTSEIKNKMKEVSSRIRCLEDKERKLEITLKEIILNLPNIPDDSVPIGNDESSNVEIRKWGEIRKFLFNPKPHWEIGENLGIFDFQNGAKLSGAKFVSLRGMGSLLSRKLINFMVENAIKNGYTELSPPYLVKSEVLFGSGQLPKFEDDLYKIDKDDLYLIPTGEVPLVNYHCNEVISEEDLPIKYVAYTSCFRREAGAAGKEGRGLIRVHQFDKVELVRVVKPEQSDEALTEIVCNAEEVLKELNLPYRVVLLCTGDMTAFSTSKTYDIEVWFPSLNKYVEISSCSNCKDFQARRANIRYKDKSGKLSFVHTLNGSGVAVGRCLAAIIENYQNEDGTFNIPEVLK